MKKSCQKTTQSGMTLVEVMLGAAILGVLAVATLISLFYPRHSVVTEAMRRAAILAGSDNLETIMAEHYAAIPAGDQPIPDHSSTYLINDRTVTTSVYRVESRDGIVSGDSFDFIYIRTEVDVPGKEDPVILETYRSPLE